MNHSFPTKAGVSIYMPNINSINSLKKLAAKKLSKLSKTQQDYYIFLAKECFAAFGNAEDNFNVYRYAAVIHGFFILQNSGKLS